MNESIERAAYRLEVGVPRRKVLGAFVTGLLGAIGLSVVGRAAGRSEVPARARATQLTTVGILDFNFTESPGRNRSRLRLYDREMGKIGIPNGRQFGVLLATLDEPGRAELSVFDLSTPKGAGVAIKRVVLELSREVTPVGVPDSHGLVVAFRGIEERDIPLSNGAAMACCVQCDPEPAPPNCGSGVCCDISCKCDCGCCQDPGASDPCNPPGGDDF